MPLDIFPSLLYAIYIYFTFTMTVIFGEESALFWWNLFVFCSSSRLNTTISRSAQIFWILERFLNCELISIWWKLFVDLWVKPGFEIGFSIWQPFQKRFVLKISILNIFSDLKNIFGLSLFGFRKILLKASWGPKLVFMEPLWLML